MTRLSLVLVALAFLTGSAAQAQFGSTDASIEQEFNNFNSGLDSQSSDMQAARDNAARNAAEVNMTNQASQQDTENSLNQQFQMGQQQMLDGGGAYNSQGFVFGAPWGMGGGGGGMGGTGSINMTPSLPATSWSGERALKGSGGYNGIMRSFYNGGGGRRYSVGD